MSASTARRWARVRCRSPSSSAKRRSRPRREETTTPSVSVSAAKTRRMIGPQPFLPPQPGAAPRTSAVKASSPIAASLRRVRAAPRRHQLQGRQPGHGLQRLGACLGHRRPGDGQEIPDPLRRRGRRRDQLRPAPAQMPQMRPRLIQLLRQVAVQLDGQPGDQHAIGLIGLMRRVILLLTSNMRNQRLDAHQQQAPLGAQPLHLQPPRPGRLARHRHERKPLRPCLPGRPVQRLTQPERLHPYRLTRQHPHIMIDHRDRLLILRQVNPDHRAITRQHRPQPLPPRVPPPVPPGHAATLAHRTSSWLRLGHQARTIAPGGRPRLNRLPQNRRLPRVVPLLR